MKFTETCLKGVFIIVPKIIGDNRGWFCETYTKVKFEEHGVNIEFVQDNHARNNQKNTLRGLHFQNNPKAQSKLLRCTRGRILDVAVDIRMGSPDYLKWVAVELTEDNFKQIIIPKGFAHGYLTLSDNVEVQYKVDEYYAPECDRSIRFDDPAIGVDWGTDSPIISQKDIIAPCLKESDCNFFYEV
jgi:dTDP-4-dehydrorhamnose 3,5-epimerase